MGYIKRVNNKIVGYCAIAVPTDGQTWNWVDDTDSELVQYLLDCKKLPDWHKFRKFIFEDSKYQTIASSAVVSTKGDLLLTNVQDIALQNPPDVILLKKYWNLLIDYVVSEILPIVTISASDVTRWQGYSDSSYVKLMFLTTGKLQ